MRNCRLLDRRSPTRRLCWHQVKIFPIFYALPSEFGLNAAFAAVAKRWRSSMRYSALIGSICGGLSIDVTGLAQKCDSITGRERKKVGRVGEGYREQFKCITAGHFKLIPPP